MVRRRWLCASREPQISLPFPGQSPSPAPATGPPNASFCCNRFGTKVGRGGRNQS